MKSLVSKWKAWWGREALPFNHNPRPKPEWVRPPAPCAPPAAPSLPTWEQLYTDMAEKVKKLQAKLEEERKLREMAQHEAAVATARQGRLAKVWPAIHQQFFTKEGEAALKGEANEKRKRRKKPCSKIAH